MSTESQIETLAYFAGLLIGLALFLLIIDTLLNIIRWSWRSSVAWLSRNMPKTYEQLNRIGIK